MSDIRFLLSGDSAVTVEFGNEISEHINAQIRAFSIALTESKLPRDRGARADLPLADGSLRP